MTGCVQRGANSWLPAQLLIRFEQQTVVASATIKTSGIGTIELINLKIAKALGIEFPLSVLAHTDKVIE